MISGRTIQGSTSSLVSALSRRRSGRTWIRDTSLRATLRRNLVLAVSFTELPIPSMYLVEDSGVYIYLLFIVRGTHLLFPLVDGVSWNLMNDLWKFDLFSGNWSWLGGSALPGQPGTYGVKREASLQNLPGGRHYANMITDDQGSNVYLFGGRGHGSWVSEGIPYRWISEIFLTR